MRQIAFDTETTGLDPVDGHRVIEIGCVELIDRIKTGSNFHVYINPERDVPPGSQKIHGITDEFLADKPLFVDIADEFIEFIGDSGLVIHNAAFDMKFINFELQRIKKPALPYDVVIDTLLIAREKFPGAKASLDALCQRYSISLARREKHGALLDAELLADVYIQLSGGTQGAMFAENNEEDSGNNTEIISFKKGVYVEARDFKLSDEELKKHLEFIKNHIKNPLWEKYG